MSEKVREPYIDNLKAIAITLVVFTHCLMPFNNVTNPVCKYLYNYMFLIHMPLFFYVSGINAKFNLKSILTKFLFPYILFQLVILAIQTWGNLSFLSHLQPFYYLWFLLTLPVFLTTTLALNRVKKLSLKWIILIASILLALVWGFIPLPDYLGIISRTICMYPFFLVGYLFKDFRMYTKNTSTWLKIQNIIILLGVFVLTYFVFDNTDLDMVFYRDYNYANILIRILRYILTFIACTCVLTLVPNKTRFYTNLGLYTKTIYLYHIFIAISASVAYNKITKDVSKVFVMMIVTILILLLMGNKWFYKFTKYTTELYLPNKTKKESD